MNRWIKTSFCAAGEKNSGPTKEGHAGDGRVLADMFHLVMRESSDAAFFIPGTGSFKRKFERAIHAPHHGVLVRVSGGGKVFVKVDGASDLGFGLSRITRKFLRRQNRGYGGFQI